MTVRVLVVEDEAIAAEAHSAYVGRVDGFEVAGVARSAGEAMRLLAADPTSTWCCWTCTSRTDTASFRWRRGLCESCRRPHHQGLQ